MNFDWTFGVGNILTLFGFGVLGVGVWYNTRGQVQRNTERIEDVSKLLGIANAKVVLALERADEIRARSERDLAEYKLTVAKEYATNQAIAVIEERIVAAIDRLGDRMDKWLDTARPSGSRTRT